MSYSTASNSKKLSISIRPRQLPTSLEPEILREITAAECKRHAGGKYQNHGQNLILSTAPQAIDKQKEFTGAAAEKFARLFTTQTFKLVKAVKAREEMQKALPPQLFLPLKELKLCSSPNKNCANRKMNGISAAVATESDRIRACRKAKKIKKD